MRQKVFESRRMTEPNKCYAYFTLVGDFDPNSISELVGVQPTDAWRKGDLHPRTGAERKFSRWSLRSRLNQTEPLEAHVKDVLDQLDAHAKAFRDISASKRGGMQLVGYFHSFYRSRSPRLTRNLRGGERPLLPSGSLDTGLLSPELVGGIRRVKGVKSLGVRVGNWLTLEQAQALVAANSSDTLIGKRSAAILALLLGCGLRRSEVVALEHEHIQSRDGHWVILDLIGKGRHIRTVPVPVWVKAAIAGWMAAANITSGHLFRPLRKNGAVMTRRLNQNVVWYVVKSMAKRCGITALAPHDLRRTCARLCHSAGGELEQIQFLLGHASVQTTERYIGCKQRLAFAVNDRFQPCLTAS